jgi:exodeoxyribonuclease VII large subunit
MQILRSNKNNLKNLCKQNIFINPDYLFSRKRQSLDEVDTEIDYSVKKILQSKKLLLAKTQAKLQYIKPKNELIKSRQRLEFLNKNLTTAFNHNNTLRFQKLLSLQEKLCALDPKNLLKKGYTILFSENRSSLIISSSDVKENDKITAKLFDGELLLTVNNVRKKNDKR